MVLFRYTAVGTHVSCIQIPQNEPELLELGTQTAAVRWMKTNTTRAAAYCYVCKNGRHAPADKTFVQTPKLGNLQINGHVVSPADK